MLVNERVQQLATFTKTLSTSGKIHCFFMSALENQFFPISYQFKLGKDRFICRFLDFQSVKLFLNQTVNRQY